VIQGLLASRESQDLLGRLVQVVCKVLLAYLEIQDLLDFQGSLVHLGLRVLPVTLVEEGGQEQPEPLGHQDWPEVLAILVKLVQLVPVGLLEQLVPVVALVIRVCVETLVLEVLPAHQDILALLDQLDLLVLLVPQASQDLLEPLDLVE